MHAVVDAFRERAGRPKPIFLQVTMSFAKTDDEAAAAAYDQWRHCAATTAQLADLPSPAAFDAACAHANLCDVSSRVRISSDIERHVEWLLEDRALGFERIYLHNVARAHQERFIDACAERVIPVFNHAGITECIR